MVARGVLVILHTDPDWCPRAGVPPTSILELQETISSQLSYHGVNMKTCMKSKSLSACRSSAVAVTLLALLIGGPRAVRADDVASLSVPVQDKLLMPLEDLKALERRLGYLQRSGG